MVVTESTSLCDNCPYCIFEMVQIDPIDRLMRAALLSDEEFIGVLNDILKKDLRITIRELSQESGIAQALFIKSCTAAIIASSIVWTGYSRILIRWPSTSVVLSTTMSSTGRAAISPINSSSLCR